MSGLSLRHLPVVRAACLARWLGTMMLAALLFTRFAGAEDFVDRVNRLRPSVVKLEGRDWLGNPRGSGTGFFISGDGLLATNEHVAALAPETAILADGTRRAVLGVLVQDEDSDLAVLRIEGGGYTPLLLGSTEGMARGEGIAVDVVQLHALLARAPASGELQALNSPTRQALHAGIAATSLVVLGLGWAWISARRERAARGAARRGR